ncbi:MAG: tRNA (N(6)-L-threonylcarbamoyladenosine(37)-C(2))-methylthiotransferase MtaB [Deltaproteobacteria bacterium]|nr:MAG: tRNA (N(6)-L-threonylcarbamoyladenosine(37)-C(2))-methylthiotransferase MtaB [Deltaproteobacteria bacterium]
MANIRQTSFSVGIPHNKKGLKVANKFKIITLGCKVNQCESESLGRQLAERGERPTGQDEAADLCIINTCTVTAKAASQSRQAVRRAIRDNPDAQIVVTGCHAQTDPEAFEKINGVNQVVGYRAKGHLPEMLRPSSTGIVDRDVLDDRFSPLVIGVGDDRTRPFLKIQDGCDAFCTYCIVPYARGRSRSMPLQMVLANLMELKASGYHETVLTGIHLGAYGQDQVPPVGLNTLLGKIEASRAPDRIRLSSIEPCELTDGLIDQVAGNEMFCRHFHIPLQSGDDGILSRMRRPYTAGFFKERVLKIIERMPDAAIGIDTLVGFPGETAQAFENTLAMIDDLPVAYLHVFPFSARPGTPAAHYPDQVSPEVVKVRCQRMRTLGLQKRSGFYRRHLDRTLTVLIENRRDRITGWLKGVTSNYVAVQVDGDDALMNRLIRVRINRVDEENRVTATVVDTGSG